MPSSVMTKRILAAALKKLMESTPFAKISIGDITKACEMNRNSFYYHFRDKYELLNWIFLTEITEDVNSEAFLDASSWEMLQAVSAFFYKNVAFYKNALSYDGQNSFSDYLREILSSLIETRMEDSFTDKDDPEFKGFFIDFFLDAFSGTLIRWVKNGAPYSPERFTDMLKKSLTGVAIRVLEEM